MKDQTSKALWFARERHAGQADDNGKPHFIHCEQVAKILESVTDDPDLITAGLLHDILEDTYTTYDELVDNFGVRVADLVKEVTHTSPNTFPNLKTKDGITLKFADRLSNISRMTAWSPERQSRYLNKSRFWK